MINMASCTLWNERNQSEQSERTISINAEKKSRQNYPWHSLFVYIRHLYVWCVISFTVTTFVKSTQSFLFSLVNPSGVGPTKMPLMSQNQKSGMVGHSGYGPTFGIKGSLFFSISRDLFISNDANKNTDSHSELGTSYECPRGQESSFLTGGKYFSVSNYEVFGIQWLTTKRSQKIFHQL